jgi:adenylyltransferase/sulfurtransferase
LIDYEEFCGMKAVEKPIKEISIEEFDEWKTKGSEFR